MFTGLVEAVGEIVESHATGAGLRLGIATHLAGELTPGDSVAVNGVCLTILGHDDGVARVDVGPETMRVTTLGALPVGSAVNLERAMRADSRFGGHFVQGHVDAVGRIDAVRPDAEFHWVTVSYPVAFAANVVHRGSIAVDGISLTVAGLESDRFDLMIIPFTMAHTNLRAARAGSQVNLEFDMVGKYVARAAELARVSPRAPGTEA
ncbi:MAG: riboflavin synthase [Vicinamibacterales bacterium]